MPFPLEEFQLARVRIALAYTDEMISTVLLCCFHPKLLLFYYFFLKGPSRAKCCIFMHFNKVTNNVAFSNLKKGFKISCSVYSSRSYYGISFFIIHQKLSQTFFKLVSGHMSNQSNMRIATVLVSPSIL